MPPCTADTTVVHMPCREFCKRITRDCGDVLKAKGIPALHCDYLFPQGDSSNGLCDVKHWPAPWPWKIPDPDIPVSGNQMKTLVGWLVGQSCQEIEKKNLSNLAYY